MDDKPENLYLLAGPADGPRVSRWSSAANGAEALAKARQEPPDLIVTNLLMPVMDGFTLLREWKADERLRHPVRRLHRHLHRAQGRAAWRSSLGADAFIVKPAEPDAFMARINEVLSQTRSGVLTAREPAAPPGEAQLKQYSEILVRKLEEKHLALELTNRELAHREASYRQMFQTTRTRCGCTDLRVVALPGGERGGRGPTRVHAR